jgi:hypothetical protein
MLLLLCLQNCKGEVAKSPTAEEIRELTMRIWLKIRAHQNFTDLKALGEDLVWS